VIAIFGNLSLLEVVVIAALSVVIFGRDLPRVAAQVVTHVARARRALQKVWRESGIGDEIRQVQREIEVSSTKLGGLSPQQLVRDTVQDIDSEVRRPMEEAPPEVGAPDPEPGFDDESTEDPDADRADEPAAEQSRRPPWYPETSDPLEAPEGEVPTEEAPAPADEPRPGAGEG